jgi:hypothetical protein
MTLTSLQIFRCLKIVECMWQKVKPRLAASVQHVQRNYFIDVLKFDIQLQAPIYK